MRLSLMDDSLLVGICRTEAEENGEGPPRVSTANLCKISVGLLTIVPTTIVGLRVVIKSTRTRRATSFSSLGSPRRINCDFPGL